MGTSCGKSAADQAVSDTGDKTAMPIQSVSKCNSVALETYMVPSKMIVGHRKSLTKMCKTIAIAKINVQVKEKVCSEFSGVLRLPVVHWGDCDVLWQFPNLLPMNVWKGEMFVFALLAPASTLQTKISLTGKLGAKDLHIEQKVEMSSKFLPTCMKTITSLIEIEFSKYKSNDTARKQRSSTDGQSSQYFMDSSCHSRSSFSKAMMTNISDSSCDESVDNNLEQANQKKLQREATPVSSAFKAVLNETSWEQLQAVSRPGQKEDTEILSVESFGEDKLIVKHAEHGLVSTEREMSKTLVSEEEEFPSASQVLNETQMMPQTNELESPESLSEKQNGKRKKKSSLLSPRPKKISDEDKPKNNPEDGFKQVPGEDDLKAFLTDDTCSAQKSNLHHSTTERLIPTGDPFDTMSVDLKVQSSDENEKDCQSDDKNDENKQLASPTGTKFALTKYSWRNTDVEDSQPKKHTPDTGDDDQMVESQKAEAKRSPDAGILFESLERNARRQRGMEGGMQAKTDQIPSQQKTSKTNKRHTVN